MKKLNWKELNLKRKNLLGIGTAKQFISARKKAAVSATNKIFLENFTEQALSESVSWEVLYFLTQNEHLQSDLIQKIFMCCEYFSFPESELETLFCHILELPNTSHSTLHMIFEIAEKDLVECPGADAYMSGVLTHENTSPETLRSAYELFPLPNWGKRFKWKRVTLNYQWKRMIFVHNNTPFDIKLKLISELSNSNDGDVITEIARIKTINI